ncbi:preprotein translocase subunit SecE [Thermodesulfitimonas sp.]
MAPTKTKKKAGKTLPPTEKVVVPLETKAKAKKEVPAARESVVKPLRREGAQREVPKKRFQLGEFIASARQFFAGAWQELKKVHWPSRREVIIYTGVVLVVVTIVMLIIWIADSVYSQILRLIIK